MSIKPPDVRQSYSQSCWAACSQSWSQVPFSGVANSSVEFEYVLVQKFGVKDHDYALDASSDKFDAFLWEMCLRASPAIGAQQFTAERAQAILGANGFFIFVEKQSEGGSHARLAYRCDGGYLYAMDPDPDHGGYKAGPVNALGDITLLVLDSAKMW